MAACLDIKVLVMAADGAAPELLAQEMMDQEKPDRPPLTYEYPLYGVFLKAPVFEALSHFCYLNI
jgi:carbohydrate-binding DOMON domain-containing protein